MKLNRPKTLVGIILVIVFLFPLILSPFYLILSTEIFLIAIFALSFNLLFGYTGLLSFGQGAYFLQVLMFVLICSKNLCLLLGR